MSLHVLTVLAVGFVTIVPTLYSSQDPELTKAVEEAKLLYQEGQFAQAVVKLQSAIAMLGSSRDAAMKKQHLAEAHLQLGLAYMALNERAAAKESFKRVFELDRERRLDPEIFAPRVIEAFEQARAELASEAGATRPAAEPGKPVKEKKRSRLPYLLLGAGGAGAGVAVALGRGSNASSEPTPSAAGVGTLGSLTRPMPQPTDVILVGLSPPPGATLSYGSVVSVALSATVPGPERGQILICIFGRDSGNRDCGVCNPSAPFGPGGGIPVTTTVGPLSFFSVGDGSGRECTPTSLPELHVRLHPEGRLDAGIYENRLAIKIFSVNYSFR